MAAVTVVALAKVMPVGNIDSSIGSVFDRQSAKPRIVGKKKIVGMRTDIRRLVRYQVVRIDTIAMQVAGKELATVFVGPVVCQVNHCTAMSMSAAGDRMLMRNTVFGLPRLSPFATAPMQMIVDRLNSAVGKMVVFFSAAPLQVHPGHDMPKVRNDRVGRNQITKLIEICTPWIHHANRMRFKLVRHRMHSPDAAWNGDTLFFGCAGFSHMRHLSKPDRPIKPTIWSPMEIVQHVIG